MAISTKVGNISILTTDVVGTEKSESIGFVPSFVIFWINGRANAIDTVGRANWRQGFGFATSATSRRFVCARSADAVAAAVTSSGLRDDACIGSVSNAEADAGRCDYDTIADGFKLIVDTAWGADIQICYFAVGGTDISNVEIGTLTPTGTAPVNQSVTLSGAFQPDVVFFLSSNDTVINTYAVDSSIGFGAAAGPNNEFVVYGGSNDTSATMTGGGYGTDAECIAQPSGAPGTLTNRAEFVSMNSDGFTINWLERTTAKLVCYLAVKGGKWAVGNSLTQTDTTTGIALSGLGGTPKGIMVVSHCATENAQDVTAGDVEFSVGAGTSASARLATGGSDDMGVADSVVTIGIEYDEIYQNCDLAGATEGLMDISTVDTDGFTLIMDDADPTQNWFGYIMVGEVAFNPANFLVKTFPDYIFRKIKTVEY